MCVFLWCISLDMSVITQDGYTALMMAAREGKTDIVSLLLEAGANTDLQNKVKCQCVVCLQTLFCNHQPGYWSRCVMLRTQHDSQVFV